MLLAAGVACGVVSLRWLRIARAIEDTPTSRLRSAAQGYVEVAGRGVPLDGAQNLAPLTQRPCVWWRYRVQKRIATEGFRSRREKWETVSSGTSAMPFMLDDGTGRCIVQPQGAYVVASESTTWFGDGPLPSSAGRAGGTFSALRDYRYFEERIYEQERVYVLGEFRSVRGDAGGDLQQAAADLLRQWKQDPQDLLQRFDRDHDGRVSLAEWEGARRLARRAVEQEVQQRETAAPVSVVGKPADDRLFLITALAEGELARRYRRRAFLALAGLLAAASAGGWLLQHAAR